MHFRTYETTNRRGKIQLTIQYLVYNLKMAPPLSDQMKAQCVLWMHETKSATLVRRKCRVIYKMKKSIPSRGSILSWYNTFLETGHIMSQVKKGRKEIDNDVIQTLRDLFEESP